MKSMAVIGHIAVGLLMAPASVAAPPNKGPDPSAPAVIVDANGKVVGPVVSLPNDSYVYYGEIGAAYRVGTQVARVGFLASPDWTFGVLTRVYRAANAHFTTSNCTGQAYAKYGLPKDYKPYAPVFVLPPLIAGSTVIPARVMRQTTQTQVVTAQSATNDDANCLPTYETLDFIVVETLGDFPFVAPFSIK